MGLTHKVALVGGWIGMVLLATGLGGAQVAQESTSAMTASAAHANGNAGRTTILDRRPMEYGVLMQSGFGITQERGGFKFLMAGVHAGKVLTGDFGPGALRGNFEYGVEVFPFWQSYTPTTRRQNCVVVSAGVSCSAPFTIGGTYTGVSITPAVLRWNFAGARRIAPWVQGGGGVIWTSHKYPAYGGPPVSNGGVSTTSIGANGPNLDTSVWNFTPQFGVGMHYFCRGNRSIDIGANAIHISSASLGDKNPGINASVQFTVGYSWWK